MYYGPTAVTHENFSFYEMTGRSGTKQKTKAENGHGRLKNPEKQELSTGHQEKKITVSIQTTTGSAFLQLPASDQISFQVQWL